MAQRPSRARAHAPTPILFVILALAWAWAWAWGLAPTARAAPPPSDPAPESARDPGERVEPAPHNELSLGWTPRVVLRRDLIASPRQYVGPALFAVALRYDRTKRANAQRLELDFAKATLRSQPDFDYLSWPEAEPATTEGSPLTYVRLRYAYLRELPVRRERLALRLGPGLDFDIQQLDWVHHPFALGGYHGVFALDARVELELEPRARHRLRASASAPLLAWATRSPYAISSSEQIYANRDHDGAKTFFRYLAAGEVQTWNRLQALRLDLRYDYRVHPHLALTAALNMRILASSVPRPVLAQDYGGALAITALF